MGPTRGLYESQSFPWSPDPEITCRFDNGTLATITCAFPISRVPDSQWHVKTVPRSHAPFSPLGFSSVSSFPFSKKYRPGISYPTRNRSSLLRPYTGRRNRVRWLSYRQTDRLVLRSWWYGGWRCFSTVRGLWDVGSGTPDHGDPAEALRLCVAQNGYRGYGCHTAKDRSSWSSAHLRSPECNKHQQLGDLCYAIIAIFIEYKTPRVNGSLQ